MSLVNAFTSTGMIIWAAVGLAGLLAGLVTVAVARRGNQQPESAAAEPELIETAQPAAVGADKPVSPKDLVSAA